MKLQSTGALPPGIVRKRIRSHRSKQERMTQWKSILTSWETILSLQLKKWKLCSTKSWESEYSKLQSQTHTESEDRRSFCTTCWQQVVGVRPGRHSWASYSAPRAWRTIFSVGLRRFRGLWTQNLREACRLSQRSLYKKDYPVEDERFRGQISYAWKLPKSLRS